jgi:hypothetical protein
MSSRASRRSRPRKSPPSLTPGAIAEALFCLDPDRDERAPQLCAETLLTLVQNGYRAPTTAADLVTPKRQRFALRSLALGENFLGGRDEGRAGEDNTTPAQYGAKLAAGEEIRGSANLAKAQLALQGLVDPDTQRGQQPGAWLLRPFHESLLWYDARRENTNSNAYTVRKVYMRGGGITLARLLIDPACDEARADGEAAVAAIRVALTSPTPLAGISKTLEKALPVGEAYNRAPRLEDDEQAAWARGADLRLADLTRSVCRHAAGVMQQEGASAPAKLWQLRTILALDFARHLVRTAWEATGTPTHDQFLLLSFGGTPRAQDPVRQRAEHSYRRARIQMGKATVSTLARRMRELHQVDRTTDWSGQFQTGSPLGNGKDPDSVSRQLSRLATGCRDEDYERIARVAVEAANYSRGAEDGFRVLLESVGAVGGTGAYRYFTAGTDLLAALVGALSAEMPMSSRDFFSAVRREWGFVINQESAADTALATQLDGARLERNARRAEKLMSDAGLAIGLSDRTTMVGERAARSGR